MQNPIIHYHSDYAQIFKKYQRIKSPVEDENLKEDFLPKGFSLNDFPKFSKILGSDKKNATLK